MAQEVVNEEGFLGEAVAVPIVAGSNRGLVSCGLVSSHP
jgi:hypothetical protein